MEHTLDKYTYKLSRVFNNTRFITQNNVTVPLHAGNSVLELNMTDMFNFMQKTEKYNEKIDNFAQGKRYSRKEFVEKTTMFTATKLRRQFNFLNF